MDYNNILLAGVNMELIYNSQHLPTIKAKVDGIELNYCLPHIFAAGVTLEAAEKIIKKLIKAREITNQLYKDSFNAKRKSYN